MTDVTEQNGKTKVEEAAEPRNEAMPATEVSVTPEPVTEQSVTEEPSIGEAMIAADLGFPGEIVPEEPVTEEAVSEEAEPAPLLPPKTFPYDLESPELARAFVHARTPRAWSDRPVEEETLQHLYDLVKLGPTSANSSPARFVFVRSKEARERLRPALTHGNVEAVMTAPVTAIVAYDPSFYDFLPRLFPQAEDARSWFAWNDEFSLETAIRNGSLQGGYLILAARLLGLDCWPMSGFDAAKVDSLFLDGRGWRANFLLSLGYAKTVEGPRNPRLSFAESCEVI
jgi:3-hydroxypropanoate dehydrogenase